MAMEPGVPGVLHLAFHWRGHPEVPQTPGTWDDPSWKTWLGHGKINENDSYYGALITYFLLVSSGNL